MIALTKGIVAFSALASAGLVAALDVPGGSADRQSAAHEIEYRFPRADEGFSRVIPAARKAQDSQSSIGESRKGDKLPIHPTACGEGQWPYIAQACLVSASGSPVRKVSRFVTVEQRRGENFSELARLPAENVVVR
jgi:hypothetical protein